MINIYEMVNVYGRQCKQFHQSMNKSQQFYQVAIYLLNPAYKCVLDY